MTINLKYSRRDKAFLVGNNVFLAFALALVLYPLIYVINCSFSDPYKVMAGQVHLLPKGVNLEGYKAVFQSKQIWTGYSNSLFYALFGTGINVFLTLILAYPLSRKDFKPRNVIMFMVTFTMLFNGGLIPTFLLVRDLGMFNTRWAMLLPNAIAVWNVIITRTYFQTNIPDELLESAQLDGCNNVRFLWSIVLPLSGSIVAVIALFYAVTHWNAFFQALIYLQDQALYPLQIILRSILLQNQVDPEMMADVERTEKLEFLAEMLKYSLIIVSSAPVMMAYPFVQKYFVKGIMVGSIKG